jgi:hypothetical protein
MAEKSSTLFVYGSLKPGELGFEQIEPYVSDFREADLPNFALYVRDGLPIIRKSAPEESVAGVLLTISEGTQEEFWRIVGEYEGTTNYKYQDSLTVISRGKELLSGAFIGRKMGKGNPEGLNSPWTSKQDPILSQSFPLLHKEIGANSLSFLDAEHSSGRYWSQMNNLLAQYLLLVSVLEHLTVIKFGGSKRQEPLTRIRKLQQSRGFLAAFNALGDEKENPPIKVSDSRAVEDNLSSSNSEQALLAWYQVRSNLQHRGKASLFDATLVQKSCVGLGNFLVEYLSQNIPEIEGEWEAILAMKLTKTRFIETF